MTYEIGHAYVTILPSMNKFKKQFAKEMGQYVPKEGKKQGEAMGKNLWGGVASSATKWAKRGAVGAAAVVTGVLGTAVVKGYQRLNNIENAEAMMAGLGFDEKEIDRIGKQAMEAVTGTAYGFGDAMSVASTAVAAGVTDIEGYITSIADISSLTQRDLNEVGGIFNKIMSRGRITMEEINQLPQLPLRQNIADFYKVTTEEAEKMISSGKVTADDFMEIMAQYDGAADEAGKTTKGAFANMQAALGRFGEMLLKDFYPLLAPMFGKIGELIGNATTFLSPHIERLATILSERLGNAFTWISDLVQDRVMPIWAELTGGFKAFVASWKDNDGEITNAGFPGVMERIGSIARRVFNFFKKTAIPAFKDLIDQFKNGEGFGGIFKTALDGVWTVVKDLFKFVKDTAVPAIQNFIDEFKAGEGAGGKFKTALENIWDAMKSAFGYVQDTVIPAISEMYDWLKDNKDIVVVLAATVLAYRGYVAAATLASTIWTAVTKGMTIAQKALNLAMSLNPVGLVIAAIVLLVGALVIAYKRHEGFRNLVNNVWNKIKEVTASVVDWFKNTAWPVMKDVINKIGNVVKWLWQNIYKPYFTFILNIVMDVVAWIRDKAWPWIRDAFQKIANKAGDLKDTAVNAFNLIRDGVSRAWDGAKRILDRFKSGLDSLKDKFSSVKDGISRVWDTLTGVIARPINKVIDLVNGFLENLRKGINKIPGVNIKGPWGGIDPIRVPGRQNTAAQNTYGQSFGPGTGGYAAGGRVPGWSPHDKADNIPAWLTAGEYVLPVRATESLRSTIGDSGMESLRRGQLPGYADGGFVGGAKALFATGTDALVGLWNNAKGFMKRVIERIMPDFGDSWPAEAVKGLLKNGLPFDKMTSALKNMTEDPADLEGGPGGPPRSNLGWQGIWGIVKSLFPDAILTSSVRNSTVAGYGTKSLHASGRAIDFVLNPWSRMVDATRILSMFMPWTELIHTPAGRWQQNRGKRTANFLPITKQLHYDHVHAALAEGGYVPNLYDNGGAIPPGLSLVSNQTGRPEQVLTDSQWQDIKQGGGNTIIVNGVKTDNAAQVAEEILFAQRRTGYGKYYRNR